MTWEVLGTNQFETWFGSLEEGDRARINDRIELLERHGPLLGRPVVDSIKTSRHHNMKELRSGTLRVLFAFDPTSAAILLLGGDKQNDWSGWYQKSIPLADGLYDDHLKQERRENQHE